jgi:hypothetical protein
LSTAEADARGPEGCCTFLLSLMYRLNQTESAILLYFVVIDASEGSLCFQIFICHLMKTLYFFKKKNKKNCALIFIEEQKAIQYRNLFIVDFYFS